MASVDKNIELTLRALEPSDLNFMSEIENDQANWAVSSNNLPLSRDALTRYIENAEQDIYSAGQFRFVISVKSSPVGFIDVYDFDSANLRAGVGIFVTKEMRNKGLAKKALNKLQAIAADVWNINQLYAYIGTNNHSSLNAFEKSGFQKVGILKEWQKQKDSFLDFHLLQWLAHE